MKQEKLEESQTRNSNTLETKTLKDEDFSPPKTGKGRKEGKKAEKGEYNMSTHSKKKGRKRRKEARNTAKEEEKKAKIYKRAGRENPKRRNKESKEKG